MADLEPGEREGIGGAVQAGKAEEDTEGGSFGTESKESDMKGERNMIRNGKARIELIDNGFLLYHDYPNCAAKPTYFKTLDELVEFLKDKVFCEIKP